MDNFYLTIPSTATEGNTQSSFVTHLAAPVELTGTWEVGLAEAHIVHDFNNIDASNNTFTIESNNRPNVEVEEEESPEYVVQQEIPVPSTLPLFDEYGSLHSHVIGLMHDPETEVVLVRILVDGYGIKFSDALRAALKMDDVGMVTQSMSIPATGRIDPEEEWDASEYHITIYSAKIAVVTHDLKIPIGWYSSSDALFQSIRLAIPREYRNYLDLAENADGTITLRAHGDFRIRFGTGLREMLGFEEDDFMEGERVSKYPIELRRGVYGIYVYSDIILPQLVGNAYGNLLRVIPVDRDKRKKLIVRIYDTPDYYPLARNTFESIDIYLRTENGEPIVFRSGKTLIKLHFRRKQ